MRAASGIIYGAPGSGKTTEMAVTFQNALFVLSGPGNLWPYESLVELRPDLGLKKVSYAPSPMKLERESKSWDPETELRAVLLPEALINDRGDMVPLPNAVRLDGLIRKFSQGIVQGTARSTGIVFDEWSEFSARMLRDLELFGWPPEHKAPFGSNWGKWSPLYKWHRQLIVRQKALNVPFMFVAHHSAPEFDDAGVCIVTGGPNMPSKKLKTIFCAAVDVVLQRGIERIVVDDLDALDDDGESVVFDPSLANAYGVPTNVQRYYYTETDPYWERKIRAFGMEPKDARDLRTLFAQARFTV